MAVTSEIFKSEYLGLPPDASDTIADLCLAAAKDTLNEAGRPEMFNYAKYDLAVYSIAGFFYDNRGLTASGAYKAGVISAAQGMINSFVLQLRGAKDGETT